MLTWGLVWGWVFSLPLVTSASNVERESYQSLHFEYLIDKKKSGIMPYASDQFEDAFRRLTDFFEFKPEKKIKVLFLDEDDYSNGYAFSAQGWVVIFLPVAEIDLRGKTTWLPNVIAHELAHVITLRKMGERSRFLGLQLSSTLAFKSGHTLDASASIPWYNTPAWLAEGLAQYGAQICGYDTLDAIRRMILNTALNSGGLLTLPEMSTFGWDGRDNEMIYTQGFSLTVFLYEKYGREAMNQVLATTGRAGYAGAFREVLKRSPDELYTDWRHHLDSTLVMKSVSAKSVPWAQFPREASYARQSTPIWMAGNQQVFLSSHRNDYGLTDLYVKRGEEIRLIARGADGPLARGLQGHLVLFTQLSVNWRTGRWVRDLYQYDAEKESLTRLTRNQRIASAAVASSGAIFTLSENGGKVRFSRLEKGQIKPIADYPVQVNLTHLTSGATSEALFAQRITGRGSDIVSIDPSNGHLSSILATSFDEREPHWNPQDSSLVFAADYSGNHQIYALKNDEVTQWTRGETSHLQPRWQGDALYCIRYAADGFRIDSLHRSSLEPLKFPVDSYGASQPFRYSGQTDLAREWKNDGLNYLGHAAFARLDKSPSQRNLFGAQEEDSPLFGIYRPGELFKWTTGGEAIWMHPGQESQLYVHAGFSDELGESIKGNPYFSEWIAGYWNRTFGPTFAAQFGGQTERWSREASNEVDQERIDLTLMTFAIAMDLPMHKDWSAMTFGQYSGITLKEEEGLFTQFSGGGSVYGQAFQYAAFQPGVNLPKSLFRIQSGLAYSPSYASDGALMQWNEIDLATHHFSKVFYRITATTDALHQQKTRLGFRGWGTVSWDLPVSLHMPIGHDAGFFLANVLPSLGLGYSLRTDENTDPDAYRPWGQKQSPSYAYQGRSLQWDWSSLSENDQADMLASLTFKWISPLRNLAYWDLYFAYPLTRKSREPFFGIRLQL